MKHRIWVLFPALFAAVGALAQQPDPAAAKQLLQQRIPEITRGGMFVWVELPPEVNCETLLDEALREERVAFVPGSAFTVAEGCASNCMRLSFSTCIPDDIEDGVRRLGKLLNRRISNA